MANRKKKKNIFFKTAKISTNIMIYVVIILLTLNFCFFAFNFGYRIFYTKPVESPPGHDVRISIPEGSSISDAASILKNANLIDSEQIFNLQAKFFNYKVKAGTYVFNTSDNSRDYLKILNEGNNE